MMYDLNSTAERTSLLQQVLLSGLADLRGGDGLAPFFVKTLTHELSDILEYYTAMSELPKTLVAIIYYLAMELPSIGEMYKGENREKIFAFHVAVDDLITRHLNPWIVQPTDE